MELILSFFLRWDVYLFLSLDINVPDSWAFGFWDLKPVALWPLALRPDTGSYTTITTIPPVLSLCTWSGSCHWLSWVSRLQMADCETSQAQSTHKAIPIINLLLSIPPINVQTATKAQLQQDGTRNPHKESFWSTQLRWPGRLYHWAPQDTYYISLLC